MKCKDNPFGWDEYMDGGDALRIEKASPLQARLWEDLTD
jgi:hypothetical protein